MECCEVSRGHLTYIYMDRYKYIYRCRYRYPIILSPRKVILLQIMVFVLLSWTQWTYKGRSISELSVDFYWSIFLILKPMPHHFDYSRFIVSHEIKLHAFLFSFSFFKIYIYMYFFQGPWHFHLDFRNLVNFPFLKKFLGL